MAAVVALVIFAVVVMLRTPETPPSAVPGGVLRRVDHNPPRKPRPATQDASCPDVQLIAVPGTWNRPAGQPRQPDVQRKGVAAHCDRADHPAVSRLRVQTYTVPYTAQFHNPMSTDGQMSYNDSRAEGTRAMSSADDINNKCPLTSYVIIGFSQGAVIAGDIVSDIGNGRGPSMTTWCSRDADRRRPARAGVGKVIPPDPPGEGAEITLQEVPILSGMG